MAGDTTTDLKSLRVDLVGSMLRPQMLKDAFARYGKGEADEEQFRRAQDEAIRDLIAKEMAHDLPIVVDGEFRRSSFMESFAEVAGVEEWQSGVKSYHEILLKNPLAKTLSYVDRRGATNVFSWWLGFSVIGIESPSLRRGHPPHLHLKG